MVSMLNKVPHWLFVVVMTFAGGFEGYLQQNTSGIMNALGDKAALEHMVIGAVFAGATSLLALAKKSWLPDAVKLLPLALVVGFGVCSVGCNPQQGSTLKTGGIQVGTDIAICALQNESLWSQPEALALKCVGQVGPDAVALVTALISEGKANQARAMALRCANVATMPDGGAR